MNTLRKSATCAAIALLLAATGCARETAANVRADAVKAAAYPNG